jgi:hypothetical protein
MSKQKNNATMSPYHVTWLRTFAEAKGGVSRAANLLGLSRDALTRAVAGLPVHRGTAALLTQQIAEHSQEAS